jgi:formylglycine-generating enzyme required for sulfatase activity
MVLLRKASFLMGSTEEEVVAALADCVREPAGHRCDETAFSNELPQRRVSVSSFWMDRTEVTVADYARCAALRRCRPIPFARGGRRFDRPRYPVSLVSWEDAARYCAFRENRLPTEAEFERAARGPGGRAYPWGNLYNSHASNHGKLSWDATSADDGFAELAPVGSYPSGATPDGLLDLAGNVSEWVSDRYLPHYEEHETVDPQGPKPPIASSTRVVRGGGYSSAGPWVRSAARLGVDPSTRRTFLGFRCARGARAARVSPTPD